MKRTSKRKDSKRKEESPTESSSKITSFEPTLLAANDKFVRIAHVMGFERIKLDLYSLNQYRWYRELTSS